VLPPLHTVEAVGVIVPPTGVELTVTVTGEEPITPQPPVVCTQAE
jgi:hypothetical protein